MGIEPSDLPHIFERFYRANSARQLVRSGTGIGLAIVKKVADLHGGDVMVESVAWIGQLLQPDPAAGSAPTGRPGSRLR